MSYFIDPWLYNCRAAARCRDSPAQQAEQATIIEAAQRALDYAHDHGVTLVAAAGNGLTDIIMPAPRPTRRARTSRSHQNYNRTVNNGASTCPTEGNNVISVSSVGPSKTKADYSNYGYGEIDVAAPGGWFRDEPWNLSMTPAERSPAVTPNQILAAFPKNVADEAGDLNPDGTPNNTARRARLQGLDVRLLPVDPGHVDGLAARGRRRRADRVPVRPPERKKRDHARSAVHHRRTWRRLRRTRRA